MGVMMDILAVVAEDWREVCDRSLKWSSGRARELKKARSYGMIEALCIGSGVCRNACHGDVMIFMLPMLLHGKPCRSRRRIAQHCLIVA